MNKVITALCISFIFQTFSYADTEVEEQDPAEVAIGERLFLETRFAQAYYANLSKADPVMDKTLATKQSFKGPFAGKTMNCRACHMVDEHAENPLAGIRSYSDYAKRPPVPSRVDGAKISGRNSMSMVNISIPHQDQQSAVFHFDGEFNSMEDLVRATYTGRNFGWLMVKENLHKSLVVLIHLYYKEQIKIYLKSLDCLRHIALILRMQQIKKFLIPLQS